MTSQQQKSQSVVLLRGVAFSQLLFKLHSSYVSLIFCVLSHAEFVLYVIMVAIQIYGLH